MQPYRDFQPTGFDAKGLSLADRQDWLVCPVNVTRDTPEWSLARSNFEVLSDLLDKIDPDGTDHEIHRFGHWGPGWFEIILVRPDSEAAQEADECEAALSDYPVLSDEDYSRREYEAACDAWEQEGDGGEMPEYECTDEGIYFRK